jgi:predicted RNA binding protein YcfA (HicA-like mRNA interferase family)
MKLPRDLSGRELADGLCRHWNYSEIHQVGSHISLVTESPVHHRIAVPAHKHLKLGMLNGILRSVAAHKGVTRQEILKSIL